MIPVLAPGSPAFLSGFKKSSPFAIIKESSQVNGAIIGNNCAQFIARFCHDLKQEGVGKGKEVLQVFRNAVQKWSGESKCHCGRLSEYDPTIAELLFRNPRLAFFQREQDTELLESLEASAKEIYQARQDQLCYGSVLNHYPLAREEGPQKSVTFEKNLIQKILKDLKDKNLFEVDEAFEKSFQTIAEEAVASISLGEVFPDTAGVEPDYYNIKTSVDLIDATQSYS